MGFKNPKRPLAVLPQENTKGLSGLRLPSDSVALRSNPIASEKPFPQDIDVTFIF